MLPNPQHAPSGAPQRARHQQIPRAIGGKFAPPERAIVGRQIGMLRTTMPETAIHQNRHAQLWKNKIRIPKDGLMPPPTPDFVLPQQAHERDFSLLIPAPPNPRHHFRPLRLGEYVRHYDSSRLRRRTTGRQLELSPINRSTILLISKFGWP